MEQAAVGSVRVANEVIASIAAMAVREIDGVAGLDQTNARRFGDWIKRETAHRGVRVALDSQRKIHLEIFVTVTAGGGLVGGAGGGPGKRIRAVGGGVGPA